MRSGDRRLVSLLSFLCQLVFMAAHCFLALSFYMLGSSELKTSWHRKARRIRNPSVRRLLSVATCDYFILTATLKRQRELTDGFLILLLFAFVLVFLSFSFRWANSFFHFRISRKEKGKTKTKEGKKTKTKKTRTAIFFHNLISDLRIADIKLSTKRK